MRNQLFLHIEHVLLKLLYCQTAAIPLQTWQLLLRKEVGCVIFNRHADDLIHVFSIELIHDADVFEFVVNDHFLELYCLVDFNSEILVFLLAPFLGLFES